MSKYLNKSFIVNLFIILSIFGLDRFTKVYVISENEKNLSSELFVSKFLNINLIYNEGIAFGLLSFDQSHMYNILTILIAAVILIIFFMTLKSDGLKKYSLLMIFGGALGNLYDRIFFKAVPDFIDFHIGNSSSGIREGAYIGTPVVNIGTRQNKRERGKNIHV